VLSGNLFLRPKGAQNAVLTLGTTEPGQRPGIVFSPDSPASRFDPQIPCTPARNVRRLVVTALTQPAHMQRNRQQPLGQGLPRLPLTANRSGQQGAEDSAQHALFTVFE